jgi:hypothetical protein
VDDPVDFTAVPTPTLRALDWRLRTQGFALHLLIAVTVLLVWTLMERGVLVSPLDLLRTVGPMNG